MRHLTPFILPRWSIVLVAVLALLLGALFEIVKPWPIKFVFDFLQNGTTLLPAQATPGGNSQVWNLGAICVAIIVVAALSSMTAYFREYLMKRAGEEFAYDLRIHLFKRLQSLSLGFHDSRKIGDLITRVSSDTTSVRNMITQSLLQVATAILTLIGMVAVMFWVDWQLALVALVAMPIMAPTIWFFRKKIERASKSRKLREVEITSLAEETMSSIRLVKAFGREAHQQQRFGAESDKSAKVGLEVAKAEAGYVWAVDVINAIGTCAVVFWGAFRVWNGVLTAGDLYVFIQYVRGVYAPLRDIAKQSGKIAKGKVGLERVIEILEIAPTVKEKPHARPAPALEGLVEFEGVSFEYLPGTPVLRDVSFRAEPGQVVALVGFSGAGKSTVLSLIPRLYDPTAGVVRLDGEDIREFKIQSIRDQTSVVLQDSVLLQTTILENILYGRPDATAEEVEAAVAGACLEEVIDRLPDGYQTVVGPKGATLSGGERQRMAIARAMVRGAPILLLDEPTTGLDVQAEALVMQALRRLMEGRTTLLISHKLSLIEQADLILLIDQGRVVESGTHDELMRAGGVYARLRAIGDGDAIPDVPDPPVVETTVEPRSMPT